MDMQAIKEEIRLQLTGCVMSLELSDESLTKIINMSFREVQRYIDTVAVITIPYEKCIDLSAYPISAVIGVRRAVGELANNDGKPGSTVMDPLYLTKWQILSRTGNISNVNDYVLNYASWSTIQQMENTTSTDLANYYDKKNAANTAGYILTPMGGALTIIGVPLYLYGKKMMQVNINYTGNGAGVSATF